MRIADQFFREQTPDGDRICMVCAVWLMTPRRQVYIGAADLEALDEIWSEITGTQLDRSKVQYVTVSSQHKTNSMIPVVRTL